MSLFMRMLWLCTVPAVVSAQTLRGSPESVDLMYTSAHDKDLAFLHSRNDIWEAAGNRDLSMISINENLTLERVKFPFVLPATLAFADSFAVAYRTGCGERLVVTSGARPEAEQPRNASPKSVHPTGMAVDFRKPRTAPCLAWMRTNLLALENRHLIEATEEMHPPHFHVAVLTQPNAMYGAFASNAPALAPKTGVRTGAAAGEVALSPRLPQTTPPPAPTATTAPTTTTPAAAPNAAGSKTYRVRAGDNLWSIAKRNNTTSKTIQELNGLSTTRLRVGQELKLP
jgi:LysM repeat protein